MDLCELNLIYQVRKNRIIDANLPFPEFMRSLRKALGLNITSVCRFCELSRHKVYRMENGDACSIPKDDRLHRLARLYDVSEKEVCEKFREHSKQRRRRGYRYTRSARC